MFKKFLKIRRRKLLKKLNKDFMIWKVNLELKRELIEILIVNKFIWKEIIMEIKEEEEMDAAKLILKKIILIL